MKERNSLKLGNKQKIRKSCVASCKARLCYDLEWNQMESKRVCYPDILPRKQCMNPINEEKNRDRAPV